MRRMFTEKQVKEMSAEALESVESGTIVDSLGIDENGKIVKGQAGGGEEFTTIDISDKIGNNLEATSNSYAKIKYSNNMLYLVISGQYKCLFSLSDTAVNFMSSQDLGLPDEVLEKIYRADGTNLSVQATAGTNVADLICSTNFVMERPNNIRLSGGVEISSSQAKKFKMVLTKATIVQDEIVALDLRLFMTL